MGGWEGGGWRFHVHHAEECAGLDGSPLVREVDFFLVDDVLLYVVCGVL